MTDLISRLESAEAGSREMDSEIAHALSAGGPFEVTRSLDAAIALVERVLPDAAITIGMHPNPVDATAILVVGCRRWEADADTAPLAICIALLRATQAKEKSQ